MTYSENPQAVRPMIAATPPCFTAERALKFSDCDPSGIAYFPSLLNLLVGVVEEMFLARGIPWADLIRIRRIGCPTVRMDLNFRNPGHFGDRLTFHVRILAVKRSSLILEHDIHHDDLLLWTATQTIVATSLDTHKAIAWPDDIRTALSRTVENDVKYSFDEIDQLQEILDAEIEGRDFDHHFAYSTATRLAGLFPEISGTMTRVADRMLEGTGICHPTEAAGRHHPYPR